MRGDWKDEAMQYRDLDRAVQARAEEEMTTLRIEDYTHAPMARLILTAGEFGRCEGEDTYHEVANVPVSARQPEAEARRLAALFALAPRMTADLDRLRGVWRALRDCLLNTAGADLPDDVLAAILAAGLAEEAPYDPDAHVDVEGLEECEPGDVVTVLTPAGARLARGGA